MMGRKLEVDWNAVQRDRDAGARVSELEKKYGVSNASIYLHTRSNGKRHAGGGEERENSQKRRRRSARRARGRQRPRDARSLSRVSRRDLGRALAAA